MVVGVIVLCQVLLICFTSQFFNIYSLYGLDGYQWLISVQF
jgi:hypothetical protein